MPGRMFLQLQCIIWVNFNVTLAATKPIELLRQVKGGTYRAALDLWLGALTNWVIEHGTFQGNEEEGQPGDNSGK